MEFVQVHVENKPQGGKGINHQLRKQHKLPGVIYGRDIQSRKIAVEEREMAQIVRNYGENAIVEFDIDGQRIFGRIKDLQKDPVSQSMIHVDIEQINLDKKIQVPVPVVLVGQEIAESQGAILQRQLSEVLVECLPTQKPKYLEAFVGQLEVGQSFRVGDIEASEELSILSSPEDIIAILSTNRLDPSDYEEVHVVGEVNTMDQVPSKERREKETKDKKSPIPSV